MEVMTLGTLLDLDGAAGPHSAGTGPRPFLSRAHMAALRILLLPYVLAFGLMFATNYRPVGDALFRVSSEKFWIAATVGILIATAVLTFFVLLGMSLYHYWRGHVGPQPASWWLWVILILNVAGVVAYYLRVIEPEQRALLNAQ